MSNTLKNIIRICKRPLHSTGPIYDRNLHHIFFLTHWNSGGLLWSQSHPVLFILILSSSSCPPCHHPGILFLLTGFLVVLLILLPSWSSSSSSNHVLAPPIPLKQKVSISNITLSLSISFPILNF